MAETTTMTEMVRGSRCVGKCGPFPALSSLPFPAPFLFISILNV
jgi:hypothetical protein